MSHFLPPQPPFEVHYRSRGNVHTASAHRKPKAAARACAGWVAAKIPNVSEVWIWCARDNRNYSLEHFRALLADDYFAGPEYK